MCIIIVVARVKIENLADIQSERIETNHYFSYHTLVGILNGCHGSSDIS